MDKSIESIWKDGFAQERLTIPKINALYNQKSISSVEHVISRFKREIFFLFPIAVFVFTFNIILDNDNAIIWGLVGALPCLFWFLLGIKQLKSIVEIDYQANSYQYLVSIREKLDKIRRFNKALAISSIPITLLPMLVYTYYNQKGKTISEIFGVSGLDWPTSTIFLIIPALTLVAWLIANHFFKREAKAQDKSIGTLIREMEELRS